jgi:hypothetical protein
VADLLAGDDKGIALRGAAQGAAGADGKLASEVGVPDEHSLVQDLHEPCVHQQNYMYFSWDFRYLKKNKKNKKPEKSKSHRDFSMPGRFSLKSPFFTF